MTPPIQILNGILFLALYIICFIALFQTYTETIGFYLLFIINTISGLYILNSDIFFYNYKMGGNMNFMVLLSLFTIFFYLVMHSVSLFFIILTMSSLNYKYSIEKKIPLRLTDRYRKYLDDFKLFMTILFSFTFLLVITNYMMGGMNGILNLKFLDFYTAISFGRINLQIIVIIFYMLLSLCVLGLSSYDFYIAFMFSGLRQKQII